jgi:hypothetical protein
MRQHLPHAHLLVRDNLPVALKVTGDLLRSKTWQKAAVAIGLPRRMADQFTPEHLETCEGWIDCSTNWATTDGLKRAQYDNETTDLALRSGCPVWTRPHDMSHFPTGNAEPFRPLLRKTGLGIQSAIMC